MELNAHCTLKRLFQPQITIHMVRIIGIVSCGAAVDFKQFIFSVHFRTAQRIWQQTDRDDM